MRLCLDEHYSHEIAVHLREAGHDVDCVKERAELVGLSDLELFVQMSRERRAILTENVADFAPLAREVIGAGGSHYGLVFSSPHSLPRSRRTIGSYVAALSALLLRYPGDDDCVNRTEWLSPVD